MGTIGTYLLCFAELSVQAINIRLLTLPNLN